MENLDLQVRQWEVYKYFQVRTTPPKPKFVVIACVYPQLWGFYINTNIPEFIRERTELLPCIAVIEEKEHPFLRWDSHLDCSRPKSFTEPELWGNYVGMLSDEGIARARTAVQDCKVIKRFLKSYILNHP